MVVAFKTQKKEGKKEMSRRQRIYLLIFVFVEVHTQIFTHSHPFQISASICNSSLFFEPPSCGTPKWVTPNRRNLTENRTNSNYQKYPAMTFR